MQKNLLKIADHTSKSMHTASHTHLQGVQRKTWDTYCVITSIWVEFVVHRFNNSSSEGRKVPNVRGSFYLKIEKKLQEDTPSSLTDTWCQKDKAHMVWELVISKEQLR